MAKITIHTRVTLNGKPGSVTGLKKSGLEGQDLDYEITLDKDSIRKWCAIDDLLREDGKKVKIKPPTLESYINELKREMKEYRSLTEKPESEGLDNLNHEESETYGVFRGKFEALEMVIKRLKKIKK